MLNIILATTHDFGIGLKNGLPWKYPEELTRFRNITMYNKNNVNNTLIMGRRTAEGFKRALPNRTNIVLTSQLDYKKDDFVTHNNLLSALEDVVRTAPLSDIFVIGGAETIRETLKYPGLIRQIYLTKITKDYVCDVHLPELEEYLNKKCKIIENVTPTPEWTSLIYKPIRNESEEYQYLDILLQLLQAPTRQTRNSITRSLFSSHMSFNLQKGFPLLTTKRVFWKGIVNELLWFLGGSTDNSWLQARGVHIWDGNTTQEFIDSCGLDYEEGDLGAMYGLQFRHYGAPYQGCKADYTGKGKDQFAEVINLLLKDPMSRRILMTSYNYDQVKLGVLFPCFITGTPVLTDSGYKPIEEVTMDDKLLTHTGKFQEIKQLQQSNCKKGKTMYKIRPWYSPHDITCTPEHPFYVKTIEFGTIRNKSTNFSERITIEKVSDAEWVNAEELTLDHYVGIPINNNNKVPSFTFEKNINQHKKTTVSITLDKKEHYLLLGYFMGDGWIDHKFKGKFHLGFCKKDEEFVTELLIKLNITYGIKTIDTNCITYWCHDYVFWNILKQFGHKAHNKIIPEWIHDAPKKFIKNFIEGYMYADGCQKTSKTDFTTVSMNLAFGLQRLYLKIGKMADICYQERPKTCTIQRRVVNQHSTYSISVHDNNDVSRVYFENNYVWFKIKNILNYETEEKIPVYNFEVENDNSYCVNNVIVHNCHSLVLQFYVDEQKDVGGNIVRMVSLQMYLRSSDVGCGISFNIASSALLLHIVVNILNQRSDIKYDVDKLHITLGDYHLYDNHIQPAITQISRIPKEFPKLIIKNNIESIESKYFLNLEADNFKLEGYNPYPGIKMEMTA